MELLLFAGAGLLAYKYLFDKDDKNESNESSAMSSHSSSTSKTSDCGCSFTPPETQSQSGDGSAEAESVGGPGSVTSKTAEMQMAPDEPAQSQDKQTLESSRLRFVTLSSVGSFQGPTAGDSLVEDPQDTDGSQDGTGGRGPMINIGNTTIV